jgi:hypothetical protein
MEHQKKIFYICFYDDNNNLDIIDKDFVENAIGNYLADSSLAVSNYEILETTENKTFKKQTGLLSGNLESECISIVSDFAPWKEKLNILIEVYGISELSKMLDVRCQIVDLWYQNKLTPTDYQIKKVIEVAYAMGR